MKHRIFTIILCFFLLSCVPDDDFTIPPLEDNSAVVNANTSLDAIIGAYFQNEEEIKTFEQDLIFEAFVVSSDEAGNFYKELIIQDQPQNPLAGAVVKLNMNNYSQFFNFGRKVFINLKGLSIGKANGVAAIGVADGKEIGNIPQSRIHFHIIRSSEVANIIPLPIEAIEFSDRRENLYVEIDKVQFSRFLVGGANHFTFASEDNDEYDGERLMENCNGGFPFILSTSTYADFSSFLLPTGSGSLRGILTRDYYDEFYTIYLNSPEDLLLSDNTRCDPAILDCGLAESVGAKVLFEDDFTLQKNNKPVTGNGWKNIVQEGSRPWEAYTATGANASLGRSVRMRPGGSGDQRSTSWLITPEINFEKNSGEVLRFKTSTSFANGSLLDVLISTEWDGTEENLLSSNWKLLPAAYIAANNDFFGDWISSGNVDLSCVEGKAYIAFRYSGSDLAYYNGIYELDEIMISAD
jgi:hypothetical protein